MVKFGDAPGEYRKCEIPKMGVMDRNRGVVFKPPRQIEHLKPKNGGLWDSDFVDEIYNLFLTHKGLRIIGRGGTGKTYVATEIKKLVKSLCMAFTNKAARVLDGQTINSGLYLNKDK